MEIRFFNTIGHCNPDDHYMLSLADRLARAQLYRYISDIASLRQTGKTTFFQSWTREINVC